ncbi:MAG: hypothetical protein K2K19_00705 [Acetatifactor sp.]|nr:hypothetical protein [Acetatifactor sp.]
MKVSIKQYLKRYLGMGLTVLLVLAALFVPQCWFALRDAAAAGRVQGEALSPLKVAQLDHSYEKDVHERMSACLAAINSQDVICSSKKIDPDSESLWENIGQAEENRLMKRLKWFELVLMAEEEGWQPSIESCMQYALMRESDGQILLVVNDIRLDKGDGHHMELLLDGVDGTIYYLESDEDHFADMWTDWLGDRATFCWYWWERLNDTYYTEEIKIVDADGYDAEKEVVIGQEINMVTSAYDAYDGLVNLNELTEEEIEALRSPRLLCAAEDGRVKIWFQNEYTNARPSYTFCCLLAFGELADSWTMEVEMLDWERVHRVRLGLPWVVHAIPEMAERISLTEYREIQNS